MWSGASCVGLVHGRGQSRGMRPTVSQLWYEHADVSVALAVAEDPLSGSLER